MTNDAEILLLGHPVAQSKSAVFQNAGLRAIGSTLRYAARDVDATECRAALERVRAGELVGANVTTPHKRVAMVACDELSDAARVTESVNVVFARDGRLFGDNTDVEGVAATLAVLRGDVRRVIILGAGGAAAAAALAASRRARVTIVNRTVERASALLGRLPAGLDSAASTAVAWEDSAALRSAFSTADVVVNATSLGLGDRDRAMSAFGRLPWASAATPALFDMSYGPGSSAFSTFAHGAFRDGATMLLHQGAAAFSLWTGVPAPLADMRRALARALGRSVDAIG